MLTLCLSGIARAAETLQMCHVTHFSLSYVGKTAGVRQKMSEIQNLVIPILPVIVQNTRNGNLHNFLPILAPERLKILKELFPIKSALEYSFTLIAL